MEVTAERRGGRGPVRVCWRWGAAGLFTAHQQQPPGVGTARWSVTLIRHRGLGCCVSIHCFFFFLNLWDFATSFCGLDTALPWQHQRILSLVYSSSPTDTKLHQSHSGFHFLRRDRSVTWNNLFLYIFRIEIPCLIIVSWGEHIQELTVLSRQFSQNKAVNSQVWRFSVFYFEIGARSPKHAAEQHLLVAFSCFEYRKMQFQKMY